MLKLKKSILEGHYMATQVILATDMLSSILASIGTGLVLNVLTTSKFFSFTSLSVAWLAGSIVFSYILFFLLRTYRSVVRHSSFRIFAKLGAAAILKGCLLSGILLFFSDGL